MSQLFIHILLGGVMIVLIIIAILFVMEKERYAIGQTSKLVAIYALILAVHWVFNIDLFWIGNLVSLFIMSLILLLFLNIKLCLYFNYLFLSSIASVISLSRKSVKLIPASLAAFGARLFFVIPGIVFTSKR